MTLTSAVEMGEVCHSRCAAESLVREPLPSRCLGLVFAERLTLDLDVFLLVANFIKFPFLIVFRDLTFNNMTIVSLFMFHFFSACSCPACAISSLDSLDRDNIQ